MAGEFPMDPDVLNDLLWRDQPGAGSQTSDPVAEAVDALPPEERSVVEGIFWERVSMEELARRDGTTRTKISRRLHSALSALREAL